MKIGIIAALDEELLSLVRRSSLGEAEGSRRVRRGRLHDHEVVVVRSDAGKVNAALAAQHLIDVHAPDLLLNVGSSGALSENLDVGDLVVGLHLFEHDFDLTAFGLERGELLFDLVMGEGAPTFRRQCGFSAHRGWSELLFQVAEALAEAGRLAAVSSREPGVYLGNLVSGDRFISSRADAQELAERHGALAADMEAAAIAHVAGLSNVPLVCLRAISDRADHAARGSFAEFLLAATDNYGHVVDAFLSALPLLPAPGQS